jgi:hypothetical protein
MRIAIALIALALIHVAMAEPTPAETKTRVLIDKLALDEFGRKHPRALDPDQYEEWMKGRRAVFAAADELIKLGAASLPFVLEHLNDSRESVETKRVIRESAPTVGDVCEMILSQQIYSLPDGYSGSLYRNGADGKLHERPVFSKDLFTGGITKWLADRKGRSYAELQLEGLSWVLIEEERIGAYAKEDEKEILAPLRSKREQLVKLVEAERKK